MSHDNEMDMGSNNLDTGMSDDAFGEGDKPPPPQKRKRAPQKPRKTLSKVWPNFTSLTNEAGKEVHRCNHCSTDYSHASSTSTLGRHLLVCDKHPDNLKTQKSIYQKKECDGEAASGTIKAWRFEQEVVRKALIKMVIIDELPFSHVEKEGFRGFVEASCPNFVIPSRYTISRDCTQLFLDEKLKLKNFFQKTKQRVSLTTDTWTSTQVVNYMCLTAHFIDDSWVLHKRIINFTPIFSHKGEAIGRAVERCLLDWGISNVMTVTVDNASSNDVAITYLKGALDNCVLDGKYLHMRCVAHIVNLVVKKGLEEHDVSVTRVRAAVKFVRQSPSRLEKFKECVKESGIESRSLLSLDCPTRWNSTFDMLNTCEKFEKAFKKYEIKDGTYKHDLEDSCGVPGKQDWQTVRKFATFLELFYKLTNNISGSLYVTSNAFFHEIVEVDMHLREYAASQDAGIKAMALKMREKYDKYWGDIEKMNMLLYVAVVLDPRYKMDFLQFSFEKLYKSHDDDVPSFSAGFSEFQEDSVPKKMIDLVRSATDSLFNEYKSKFGPPLQASKSQGRVVQRSLQGTKQLSNLYKMSKLEGGGTSMETKTELDRYLNEECDDGAEDFDILLWWKINSARFPILSRMAKDVLAIPISTVASESAFSTSGRVLDVFRSSLSPPIVEALICTQDWIRKSRRQIKVEEDLENIDNLAKELCDVLQLGETRLGSTAVGGSSSSVGDLVEPWKLYD